MTYGNLAALRQTDIKRLLAYSSIAHAGYLLLGLAVFRLDAVQAMVAYLIVYLFMNLTVFWIAILLVRELGTAEIAAYRGLAFRSPYLFTVLFIALIALTGLPPTAGFAAKFLLFKTVVNAGVSTMGGAMMLSPKSVFYFSLALCGVLNSAVSLFYYMKIAKVMVFEEPDTAAVLGFDGFDKICAGLLVLPVLLLLNFGWLVDFVDGVLRPSVPLLLAWIG